MWIVFVLLHSFFLSLVNYTDEYLTTHNKLLENASLHVKIGGLLLISTLLNFVGAGVISLVFGGETLSQWSISLAILSAIPMVGLWAAYFYLLNLYPVYQVIPLMQMSTLWLLLLEVIAGGTPTVEGLIGVGALIVGAYFLDAGAVRWQIPTRLLFLMIPTTLMLAASMFLVRLASEGTPGVSVAIWQMIGIGAIGVLLFLFVRPYRKGFLVRVSREKRTFVGLSLLNEGFAQTGYTFLNLALAAAPVATYVSALTGVESVFVLTLFLLFPQSQRKKINLLEILAILLMATGVFLIEMSG